MSHFCLYLQVNLRTNPRSRPHYWKHVEISRRREVLFIWHEKKYSNVHAIRTKSVLFSILTSNTISSLFFSDKLRVCVGELKWFCSSKNHKIEKKKLCSHKYVYSSLCHCTLCFLFMDVLANPWPRSNITIITMCWICLNSLQCSWGFYLCCVHPQFISISLYTRNIHFIFKS